jgi:hemoglobin
MLIMSTLYERLGGETAVDTAVGKFYDRVLADERIASFFDGMNMHAQARKQKLFLTKVFGGPNNYDGQDMRAAHTHLELEQYHFDAVVENLAATLRAMGVCDDDIAEVEEVANAMLDDVLDRQPSDRDCKPIA